MWGSNPPRVTWQEIRSSKTPDQMVSRFTRVKALSCQAITAFWLSLWNGNLNGSQPTFSATTNSGMGIFSSQNLMSLNWALLLTRIAGKLEELRYFIGIRLLSTHLLSLRELIDFDKEAAMTVL